MNYDDTTIDLPAGFSVDYNGLSADVESVAISPIDITVDYTAHDVMNWQDQSDGQDVRPWNSKRNGPYSEPALSYYLWPTAP